MTKISGFGFDFFGRSEVGNVESDIEPRFYVSTPTDGATVTINQNVLMFSIYGFSSRVQEDDFLFIEVSEDGAAYVPAYFEGAFIGPYSGPYSMLNAHRSHPHLFRIRLDKTDLPWDENAEIKVRVTAQDSFDQEATKTVVQLWGGVV